MGVRPQSGLALNSLGRALQRSGQLEEAADTFRRLIALRPDDAHAHVSLGAVLMELGERRAAEAEFREARRLKPDDWMVRDQIANVWLDRGDWDAAIDERREAVQPEPTLPSPTRTSATPCSTPAAPTRPSTPSARRSASIPGSPQAQVGLARALLARGEFKRPATRSPEVEAGRASPSPEPELVRKARRMVALDARLPALLRGQDQPADAAECAEFAQLCSCRQIYATSARLWSEAFAAQPGLADDLGAENRYQAARAAALAGCGRGKDEPPPDDAARKRWRQQALDWLRAELAAVAGLLDKGTPRQRADVPRRLGRWRVDPALAGIRDEAALATLPEAERQCVRDLWSRVLKEEDEE